MAVSWKGEGIDEVGIATFGNFEARTIIKIDARHFRPTEVETLLGDPTKAKEKLGWTPKTSFSELVREMVTVDLREAEKDDLCVQQGFPTYNHHE